MKLSKKKAKSLGIYLLISVLVFLISVPSNSLSTVRGLELSFRDQLFEWRGPQPVEDSPIVMVAISQQADDEIPEKYPWPTSIYARLVNNLKKAGAKVIIFDVIFDQPDQYDPKNDSLFAEAIANHGKVVLAGQVSETKSTYGSKIEAIFPQRILTEADKSAIGMVEVRADVDGFVRSYTLGNKYRNDSYYILGVEGLRLYYDLQANDLDRLGGTSKEFSLGSKIVKKNNNNSFIINYYGPEETFPVYSLDEVIDDPTYTTVMEAEAFENNLFDDPEFESGLLYDEVFKDKIVIVGATMALLKDFYATPFAGTRNPRPGYEIHAHAMQTMLDDNYLTVQSNTSVLLLIFISALIMVLMTRWVGALWGFLIMALLMTGYGLVVSLAFLQYDLVLNLTAVLTPIFLAQISTVGYEYVGSEKEKRRIKGMFSSYVSPKLVEQMIDSGIDPQLGGDEIHMTAFFSDIESFSTFSEKLDAKELVSLINEYLTAMTNILNTQGGTLDKYIGDAIVGFFGAPVPVNDHALKACIASQLMQKELLELRKKWKQDGWPEIVCNMKNRIGINTGAMVTGNMGSTRRFNYTMMGDNVNLAARCESGAKQYGVYTMVTEATKLEAEQYGDDCVFRFLDNIIVKGRTKPVKMYEVADLRADASEQLLECLAIYGRGMEHYSNREWDLAIEHFMESVKLERFPNNPSQLFLGRSRHMRDNPPRKDWDGVFVMTMK